MKTVTFVAYLLLSAAFVTSLVLGYLEEKNQKLEVKKDYVVKGSLSQDIAKNY